MDWVKQFFSVSIVNINMMTRSFILDIRTLHVRSFFSLWFSKFFSKLFWLLYLCCYIWLLYLLACQWVTVLNLLLYICFLIYLLVLARDRFFTNYICLKKSYFPISHENYLINISPYLRELANLGCQLENKLLSEYMTFLSFYYKIMKKPYMRINYQKF